VRKLQSLILALATAALLAVPATPASATHSCGGGPIDLICGAQHLVLDKLNWLIECKILHNC
jgi:hypothetical protein